MTEKYLTVTALTKYIKRKFDADPYLDRVFLTGEISNFRMRANAHQYFSLKDDQSKISAIMFKGAFNKLKFQPEEGMKVLVIGRISLYEASGNYQIYIEHMEPDGVGALYQALEKRKIELQKEGLFNPDFKLPLPSYPKRIAVVTSPSGAVIRDIMTTIKRRYPIVQLVVFPTLVQGDKAAADITRRIKEVDALGKFDTMIVARGGGSIEDLWPFNEEIVARAIFESRTPIVSSVGHETDITIADLVADVRAATPTAAAEISTPVLSEELLKIKEKENRLNHAMNNQLKYKKQQHEHMMNSVVFKQPERLYEAFSIQLDMLNRRLEQGLMTEIQLKEKRYRELRQTLYFQNPQEKLSVSKQHVDYLTERLNASSTRLLKEKQINLSQMIQNLDMLSPLKTMLRGYSYVKVEDTIIKSVSTLTKGQTMTVHLADGEVAAEVLEVSEEEKN
ncbi:MAG: exodeoxyribonuclease VII large subunit [Vagococcus sp.]|uniref:exodeoxyribonuclease VII large subunit n=1 Tax=Vagococcus sp. TaxID=1933889 RepID=UPI002FCC4251